ncbi:WhiB family transcriptional regulator [Rhodococcoides fascians]|uniref:WhiB family transcriptional regulator n=1 Tax=Rhodococcoides fascians TaxID=1828 RepID=UPI0018D8800D
MGPHGLTRTRTGRAALSNNKLAPSFQIRPSKIGNGLSPRGAGPCRRACPPGPEHGVVLTNRDAAAAAVCRQCPVVAQCRQDALAARERYGYLGRSHPRRTQTTHPQDYVARSCSWWRRAFTVQDARFGHRLLLSCTPSRASGAVLRLFYAPLRTSPSAVVIRPPRLRFVTSTGDVECGVDPRTGRSPGWAGIRLLDSPAVSLVSRPCRSPSALEELIRCLTTFFGAVLNYPRRVDAFENRRQQRAHLSCCRI